MNFEFVGLYPAYGSKEKELVATCHLYDTRTNLDIRGIKVICKKDSVFVRMPSISMYDYDEQKTVMFPVLTFSDKKEQDDVRSFIIEKTKKELLDIKLPRNFPKTKQEFFSLLKKKHDNKQKNMAHNMIKERKLQKSG